MRVVHSVDLSLTAAGTPRSEVVDAGWVECGGDAPERCGKVEGDKWGRAGAGSVKRDVLSMLSVNKQNCMNVVNSGSFKTEFCKMEKIRCMVLWMESTTWLHRTVPKLE